MIQEGPPTAVTQQAVASEALCDCKLALTLEADRQEYSGIRRTTE